MNRPGIRAEHVRPRWLVKVREPVGDVLTALSAEPWVGSVAYLGGGRIRVEAANVADGEAHLVGALGRAAARVVAVEPEVADLESVFLGMTGGAQP